MHEIRVYLLPYWTVKSIKDISKGSLDILINEGYHTLKGKIPFKDFTDGAMSMDSFNRILKLDNNVKGNNLLNTYCDYYSEHNSLYPEILSNLEHISKEGPYKIHNISDNTIVIEMKPGFSPLVSVKGKRLFGLYRDILCELLKITSFSSLAGTKLYGCYLQAV